MSSINIDIDPPGNLSDADPVGPIEEAFVGQLAESMTELKQGVVIMPPPPCITNPPVILDLQTWICNKCRTEFAILYSGTPVGKPQGCPQCACADLAERRAVQVGYSP